MQLHLKLGGDERADVASVRERLAESMGSPSPLVRRDPVAQLVRSLIASRTQDAVSDEVLARLRAAFRPLARIAEARAEEVACVIAPVTHAERKAPQLVETLRRVGRLCGGVRLDFLADWPLDDAMLWLQELPGVGQRVAASVLNFSTLRRRVLVVDTHVWRVARRLGLAAADADAGEVRLALMDHAPDAWEPDDFTDLHRLLKHLGELHCHASMPECPGCPLRVGCPEGEERFGRRVPSPRQGSRGASRAHPAPGRRPGAASSPSAANENEADPGASDAAWGAYLRRRIARIEARGRRLPAEPVAPVAFGVQALDAVFDGRGLPPGAHQAAAASPGDHAAPLILPLMAAAQAPGEGVKLLIVQERAAAREGGELYAPGLEALGVAPAEIAFVRVQEGAEVLRVADEAVKRRAVPVVLAELRRGASLADLAATRRLNLAAQRRGLFLFFITPDLVSTSAALTRWRVASAPSRAPPLRLGPPAFHLHLHRNRLGPTGAWAAEWSPRERRFTSALPFAAAASFASVAGSGSGSADSVEAAPSSLAEAAARRAGGRAGATVAAPVDADAAHRPAAAGAA